MKEIGTDDYEKDERGLPLQFYPEALPIEEERMRQARIPCGHCGHSGLNHQHYPPEAQHCGYPGCTCVHYRPAPTPQPVIDAAQAIAGYMKELGYETATVHISGGISFKL